MKTRSLLLVVSFVALQSLAHADEISFLEIGKVEPMNFAIGKMEIQNSEEGVQLNAPNFWSCGAQVQNAQLPPSLEPGKVLKLKASGTVPLQSPVVEVHLISADWGRADIYSIPLEGIAAASSQEFVASSPLGEPVEKKGDGLSEGESAAHIQLLVKGQGNSAVNLTLHSLAVGEK